MLKAGFARIDITPTFGIPLAGYFHDRFTKGVRDPLYANAIALSDGTMTAVLIALDVLGVSEDYANTIRTRIAKKCNISADHILLHSLHQHTSFALRPAASGTKDPVFLEIFYRKLEDVSAMAIEDLSDATPETASGETEVQLSFVRRYVMKNGPVATNPGRLHPDLVRPASDPDNTVRLIRFRREEKKDIALVNFSTHPDVIGGEKVSADWPGFVRTAMERDVEAHCIVVNGAQGDVNHIDFFKAKQWDDRYEHSRFMGETIAKTAKSLWDQVTPCKVGPLYGEYRIHYTRTNTDNEDEYESAKAFYAAYKNGELDYKPTITELGRASRIINLRTARIYQSLPITVLGCCGFAFVGFAGEPFTVYAANARNAAPDKFVISLCNTNGTTGYLPSEQAFSEGGYESSGSVFTPAIEQECTAVVTEMLSKF